MNETKLRRLSTRDLWKQFNRAAAAGNAAELATIRTIMRERADAMLAGERA